jgi:hypothetical protein
MPRGVSRYDEAYLQRRLWRPGGGDKSWWFTPGQSYLTDADNSNMFSRSQEFDHADWANFSATGITTANAGVAPDGTTTADKIINNSGTTNFWGHIPFTTVSGNPYTMSLFAKPAPRTTLFMAGSAAGPFFNGNCEFDLTTLSLISIAAGVLGWFAIPLDNGWFHIGFTGTGASTSTDPFIRCNTNGDGSSGLLVWGALPWPLQGDGCCGSCGRRSDRQS